MNVKLILTSLIFVVSCSEKKSTPHPLQEALSSENKNIRRVMDSVDRYQVQIKYSRIDRRNDSIIFTDYEFQVNDSAYFYPASTVKFPTAVLALERLHQTDTLNVNSRYYIEGDTIESTFLEDVSKIFAVSDNLANNRLIELLGQDYINASLRQKGIRPVRISHRLGHHSEDLNTKPLIIYLNDSTTGVSLPSLNSSPKALSLSQVKKGKGYYDDDIRIDKPFDFSLKNYYPISAQHALLKRVIFPNSFNNEERFNLSDADRTVLLDAMRTVPRKVGYDETTYYDGYCKFFLYGDTKERIPEHIEIYNKVGFAYGTLTDCAYIKDTKNNIDFLLTATILVNQNGIFNDDTYEYDEIGIPFLAELGRELYAQELARR
ncbi:MAG: serine hydrolase [Maribacter sp.]